MAVFIEQ